MKCKTEEGEEKRNECKKYDCSSKKGKIRKKQRIVNVIIYVVSHLIRKIPQRRYKLDKTKKNEEKQMNNRKDE